MATVPTATRDATHFEPEPPRPVALLGRTLEGNPQPRMRRRLTPAWYRSDPVWGWLAPIIICLLAGILRFWHITTPHKITFDETYYAKDAYSLLIKQYASNFVNDGNDDNGSEADAILNDGSTEGIFADGVNQVVHPEVGKWMIAFGEWAFGMNPLGWRFSSALVGTLMVLVMCRLVRRLTGSTLLGCTAGILLALDGLHFVMSRIALLDIFLAFWLLCGVHCMVADRDWARARFARRFEMSPQRGRWDFGPVRGFLLRPWRIAAGVCFGLACGTKWSAVFVVAGFGLLSWAWDSGMRRAAGVRWAPVKSLVVDALPALVSVVLVGLIVYVGTWMSFLTHDEKYEEAFGHAVDANDWTWSSVDDRPDNAFEGAAHDLNALWNYHKEVYLFHTGEYLAAQFHPWQSHPAGWLVLNRPIAFAVDSDDQIPECPPEQECVREILAIGNPVLWWGGVVALVIAAGYWVMRRDWRFGVALVGLAATWLPWLRYDNRQIFFYYGVSIIPFTVIAVTLVLGKMLGPAGATQARRMLGSVAAAAFVVCVAASFVYFYPILSHQVMSIEDWRDRLWLTYWNKSVADPSSSSSS